jgi:hypothetical protein
MLLLPAKDPITVAIPAGDVIVARLASIAAVVSGRRTDPVTADSYGISFGR